MHNYNEDEYEIVQWPICIKLLYWKKPQKNFRDLLREGLKKSNKITIRGGGQSLADMSAKKSSFFGRPP